MIDSKVYRALEVLTNFVFLNLLWVLVCVPVLTMYPATAAMFGVLRKWIREEDYSGVFAPFFASFKENFKQSLWIGVVWTLVGVLLAVDLALTSQVPAGIQLVLYGLFSAAAVLYFFTSMYLFPVMINYDVTWTKVIKNSFLLSIGQPFTTACCLLIFGAAASIFVLAPITILVTGSVTAYAIYRLYDGATRRAIEKQE